MTSPTLAHAMQWLREGSLDPLAAPAANGDDAFDRVARLFDRVFSGPDGEAVIKVLLDVTLFRSPVDHRLDGEAYLRHAQTRAGQNQTMATIVAYLDHAKTLKERSHGQSQRTAGDGGDDGGSRPSLDDIRDFFDRDSLPGGGNGIDDDRSGDWTAAVR